MHVEYSDAAGERASVIQHPTCSSASASPQAQHHCLSTTQPPRTQSAGVSQAGNRLLQITVRDLSRRASEAMAVTRNLYR